MSAVHRPLLLIALALAAAVAVLVALGRSGDESARGAAARAVPSEVTTLAGPAAADSDESAADTAGRTATGAARLSFEDSSAPPPTRRLYGRVVLPRQPEAETEIEVVVLDDPVELEEYLRRRDALDVHSRVETQPGVVATTAALPDGTFDVQVPATGPLWALAHGRFAYTRRPIPVPASNTELVLSAELGAWIVGRVVDEGGGPAAGATLAVLREEAPVSLGFLGATGLSRRGTDLGAGRFELRAVPAGGPYRLLATPSELATATREPFGLQPGEHLELELVALAGGHARGRVVDENNRPVAGAHVVAERGRNMMSGRQGDGLREATTDAGGAFQLRALPHGPLSLRAVRRGYLDASTSVDIPRAGDEPASPKPVDVELVLERGRTLRGRVEWPDGRPAEGVPVVVRFDLGFLGGVTGLNSLRGGAGRALSDADGRFELAGLGKGPFTVSAAAAAPGAELPLAWDRARSVTTTRARPAAPGAVPEAFQQMHPPADGWYARVDGVTASQDPRSTESDVLLVLEAPLGVTGSVRTTEGEPVERFTIQAAKLGEGFIDGLGTDVVRAGFDDPTGGFALAGLRSGSWELTAFSEGFARSAPVTVPLPRPADAPPIEVLLQRAAVVRGKVVGPNGAGVAGATVALHLDLPVRITRSARGEILPATTSGDGGAFELTGLPATQVALVAEAADWARSEEVAFSLEPGAEVEDVQITLRRGGLLTGLVFDEEGERAAARSVLVQIPGSLDIRQSVTDEDGEFAFEHLVPAVWQVIAMPDASALHDESDGQDQGLFAGWELTSANIRDDSTTHVVLGAPPEDPVTLRGRVTLGDKPVGGVLISFLPDGGSGATDFQLTTTGSDGEYEIVLNEPGGYLISVQRVGELTAEITLEYTTTVPEAEEHRFDIALPLGRISGRVLRPDGSPHGGARVTLSTSGPLETGGFWGGVYTEMTAESDGSYVIEWLRPGRYDLSAGGPLFGGMLGTTESLARSSVGPLDLGADEWLEDVDFRLVEPGSISGRVLDRAGLAIAGASVFVRDDSGRVLDRLSMVTTDASGFFRYAGLAPGQYTVGARAENGEESWAAEHESRVRVDSGATVSAADLVLDTGTVLLVSVLGPDGEPLRVRLQVLDEDGRQVNGIHSITEIMERFGSADFRLSEERVGPLPAGRYRVEVFTDEGRTVRKSVTLSGQPERKLKVRVRR